MTDLSYPIGKFTYDSDVTPGKRTAWIRQIAEAPAAIRAAIDVLSGEQLDRPYRPGGWTVRQLVHHVADSHMNGLIRVKLALTEDSPTIKPYAQQHWANLPDAKLPIELSLRILDGVHERLDAIVSALTPDDYAKTFVHPENGLTRLDNWVQLYAWHSRHHVAHITELRKARGW